MGPEGPKRAREDFFLLIQTLPTFWAERILILRIFIFWGPKFLAWAHLDPAWAHPLGPGVGPPLVQDIVSGPGLAGRASGQTKPKAREEQPQTKAAPNKSGWLTVN